MNNKIVWSIAGFLILAVILGLTFGAQKSILGNKPLSVNIPELGSVYCANCQASVESKIINVAKPSTWSGYSYEVYDCLKSQSTGIQFYTGSMGCTFDVSVVDTNSIGETFIYVCDINTNANNVLDDAKVAVGIGDGAASVSGCSVKQEIDGTYSGKIAQNQYLHIVSEVPASGKILYNSLCLWTDVRGQINSYNTCDIRTLLGDEVKDVPSQYDNLGIMTAGKQYAIQNAVIGYSGLVKAAAVVKLPGTSEWVYLAYYNGEIRYYELNTADDGSVYVDMNNPKTNKAFICVPGIIDGCIDGIKLSATECSQDGYMGEFLNLKTRCQKYCQDGKIVVKDCKEIVDPIIVVPIPEVCNDKLDNDKNGLVDTKDPACQSTKEPLSGILILLLIVFLGVGGVVGYKISEFIDVDTKWVKTAIIIGSSIIIGLLLFLITKGMINFFKTLTMWG